MLKEDLGPTKLLHVLTWGAFDHASHAHQVRACTCNYYVQCRPVIINLQHATPLLVGSNNTHIHIHTCIYTYMYTCIHL